MHTKRLRVSMLLTGIALFVTAAMYAQGSIGSLPSGENRPGAMGHHGPPSPAMELDHLTRIMKAAAVPLSNTQKVAVLGILEDQQTAGDSLRQEQDGTSHAGTEEQLRSLMQSSRSAIRAVLTEAQARVFGSIPPPAIPGGADSGHPGTGSSQEIEKDSNHAGLRRIGSSDSFDDSSLIDANTGGMPPQGMQ